METGVSTLTLLATPNLNGQVDIGILLQAAHGSWDRLRALLNEVTDDKKRQLSYTPFKTYFFREASFSLGYKLGKTWNVSFQYKLLEQFPWLSYSPALSGGICRYCIHFPGSQLEAVVWELEIDQVF